MGSTEGNFYIYNGALKNMKSVVRSLDGHIDFPDTIDVVLEGDTLAPYLLIICLDDVQITSIDLIKQNELPHLKDKK